MKVENVTLSKSTSCVQLLLLAGTLNLHFCRIAYSLSPKFYFVFILFFVLAWLLSHHPNFRSKKENCFWIYLTHKCISSIWTVLQTVYQSSSTIHVFFIWFVSWRLCVWSHSSQRFCQPADSVEANFYEIDLLSLYDSCTWTACIRNLTRTYFLSVGHLERAKMKYSSAGVKNVQQMNL